MSMNNQLEQKIPNAQCNHSTNLKHNVNFSNPKILDKEHNLEKRLILEMIKIISICIYYLYQHVYCIMHRTTSLISSYVKKK